MSKMAASFRTKVDDTYLEALWRTRKVPAFARPGLTVAQRMELLEKERQKRRKRQPDEITAMAEAAILAVLRDPANSKKAKTAAGLGMAQFRPK